MGSISDRNDRLKILYVDDEPINLRLMRDVFTMVLHRPDSVVTAASGEEALKLLKDGSSFDVVICDQRMPGMSGTALLAQVRQMAPSSARMILTGYPSDAEVRAALESGVAEAILPKPWKAKELEGVIQGLVSRSAT